MEIDFAHTHNPNLFGSLSVSPPASMFDSFSPLLHLNDDFLDVLNPTPPPPASTMATTTTTIDDDADDWMKPFLLDQLFEHDFLSPQFSSDEIEFKDDNSIEPKRSSTLHTNNCSLILDEKYLSNTYSHPQLQRENEFLDLFHSHTTSEQQLPSTTTTTTTVRLIHQPKIEPAELPTTLFVSGNELQFQPIVTTNKTIGHTYTSNRFSKIVYLNFSFSCCLATTSSPIPSVPIVPARVLKGKKFKRGGRVTSRA